MVKHSFRENMQIENKLKYFNEGGLYWINC